ncbi:hypothetical protein G6F29_013292 [Rhizopus arrhizus]|nr:hypothetical protein G6F29_013292 [Rhizopus arrhizus]
MPPTRSTAVTPGMIDPTAPIMDAMTDLAGRSSLQTPTTRQHRRSRRRSPGPIFCPCPILSFVILIIIYPLTIGLWNANGLQESTAEDLLRHCQSFSLVFITETWLLPPHRIRTSWTQFNLYGSPVINSYRGSQGVSALVSPRCPMAVVQFPVHTKYALGLRLGRSLRLICLYLPPSLSNDEVSSVLVSLPLTDDTIICGDLNARLGALTGDSNMVSLF